MSNEYEIPIPLAAARAFHGYSGATNPGLIFDRFAPDWSGQATLKKDGLEAVRKAAERAERVDDDLLRGLLPGWNARWEACTKVAHAEPFTLKTDWRFIAGLGRKGPLEVGFTFHRYGFPILPGSSVKGIARASALLLHQVKESDADFIAIFGYAPQSSNDEREAQIGGAIFFDAIPTHVPKLKLDVMNPHYPKYYSGEEPPTDWQSPVPVYFLTVAPGTEFRFAVGWRGPRGQLDAEGQRLRDLAKQWLVAGLTELGAGAKTSAGYGYFVKGSSDASPRTKPQDTPQPPPPPKPQPTGELKKGQGRLRRERQQRVWIQDGDQKIFLKRELLGEAFNSLPGDKTDVNYEYDEENGERRVWRVQRKPRF